MKYRTALSISFIILVLVASSSFMIGIHRCGKIIQNIAVLSKAQNCGMEMQAPTCDHHETNPCCQDETIVHDPQGFKNTINQINISATQLIYTVQPSAFIVDIIPSAHFGLSLFYNYDPPLPGIDRTVTLQVFLI